MQIDSVQYLLVVIGKADILQLDGVIGRQLFRAFRALHIFAGQHLRHLVHDGLDLGDVIGVGKAVISGCITPKDRTITVRNVSADRVPCI